MSVMSSPMTLTEGRAQSRSPIWPVPVSETPSRRSALARKSSSLRSAPGPDAAGRPATVTLPSSSCSVDRRRAIAIMASGAAPPKTPECSGCSSVRTVTMQATSPRRAVVSTGSPTLQVAHVADDEQVAREQLRVRLDERLEVALGLLHPLQDELEGARRLAVEDAQGAQVRDQPALVVGGATTVDPAVVLAGRGPRVARPALLRRCGLHVVVGVQHDCRRPFGAFDLAVDRRVARRDLHQPCVGEPDLAEHLQRHPSHLLDGLGRVAGEGDRRDRHQLLQVREQAWHQGRGPRRDLVAVHRVLRSFRSRCGSSVRKGQKKMPPISAPTAIVVTDMTSIGTKKLWSISLVPSFVVPVRSKFAAAICVPLAGSV